MRDEAWIYERCGSMDELWSWAREALGVSVPRRRVCAGHAAPLEYLA